MNINSIKQSHSFKGAYKLDCPKKEGSFQLDDSVYEVERVLNGKESNLYTKDEAKALRSAFLAQVEDYKNEVLIRPAYNNAYIFTGEEAKKLKQFEDKNDKSMDEYVNSHNIAVSAVKRNESYELYKKQKANKAKEISKDYFYSPLKQTAVFSSSDGKRIDNIKINNETLIFC